MKKHLNTLYVSTQGTYLSVEGETVLAKVEHEVKLRVPMHMLEGIVCFGNVLTSPFLLGRCSERGIGFSFLTERGRFLARVQGPVSGNVLLRRAQYRRADDEATSTEVARAIVQAKVLNSRRVMQRALRDKPEHDNAAGINDVVSALSLNVTKLKVVTSVDSVRGLEGDSARAYFSVFDDLILTDDEVFRFRGRNRRPPTDPINALLSFIYTLLLHDVESALEAVGLDPQVGFLHRDRPGRPGLALDMMEEFRAYLADRLVLSLVNRKQVKPKGFEAQETGGVYMDEDTRKTVLKAYQERKLEEILHPYLDEKMSLGMLVHMQAMLMARHLRGDIDAYPPFLWK